MTTYNTGTLLSGQMTPDGYRELAKQQHVSPGSTRAVALPALLPGYQVTRSTLNGAPKGWRHSTVAQKVCVDPDLSGEGFIVDLSKVSADAFQRATHAAALQDAESIEELRDKASMVFRAVSGQRPVAVPSESPEVNPMDLMQPLNIATAPKNGQNTQTPFAMVPNAGLHKAAAFTQEAMPPAQMPQPAPAPQPQVPAQPRGSANPPASLFDQVSRGPARNVAHPLRTAGGPPTYKVTFEVKGSPIAIETWYHDVIRNDHVLVLVYDTSCVGYPRSRLQPTENDICVYVDGSDAIYVAKDPSISFTFDSQEFQVLLIKATHPYQQAEVS